MLKLQTLNAKFGLIILEEQGSVASIFAYQVLLFKIPPYNLIRWHLALLDLSSVSSIVIYKLLLPCITLITATLMEADNFIFCLVAAHSPACLIR